MECSPSFCYVNYVKMSVAYMAAVDHFLVYGRTTKFTKKQKQILYLLGSVIWMALSDQGEVSGTKSR